MDIFCPYLRRWRLEPDGEPVITPRGALLPVRAGQRAAMLKIALCAEEQAGNALMAWWRGCGAARVLAWEKAALLLERAEGTRSLASMAVHGRDDEACRILCACAQKLHRPRITPFPELVPLRERFRALKPAAETYGGILRICAAAAAELLASPREITVLHGDLHHGNVLDFAARGWLAIDPKGLLGERGFEYANIFCNPAPGVVLNPVHFARRVEVVAEAGNLEQTRLLQWTAAWAGLSAAWFLEAGEQADTPLKVAALALAALYI